MQYGPFDDEDLRIGQPPSGSPLPARRRRRRWPYVAAVVVVLLAGGGAAAWAMTRDTAPAAVPMLTITGELDMPDGGGGTVSNLPCQMAAGYNDIQTGAQITVTDEAGKVIGLGQLGAGLTKVINNVDGTGLTSWRCEFRFSVPNIPAGHQFFGLEVTHRGVVRFTADQIESGKVKLTLGS